MYPNTQVIMKFRLFKNDPHSMMITTRNELFLMILFLRRLWYYLHTFFITALELGFLLKIQRFYYFGVVDIIHNGAMGSNIRFSWAVRSKHDSYDVFSVRYKKQYKKQLLTNTTTSGLSQKINTACLTNTTTPMMPAGSIF